MKRWITAGCWAIASGALGLAAAWPLVFAFTLIVTVVHGPYPATANHLYTTEGGRSVPVEIDGDEIGVVGFGLVVAAFGLGLLFAAVNGLARRRLPGVVRAGQWYLAAALLMVPGLILLGRWWAQ